MSNAENSMIDPVAFYKLSYGLFVLTTRLGEKDNGCIINTAIQLTEKPYTISICVNKANHTHDMIMQSRKFNLCTISEKATFDIFKRFGFASGRDTDKFAGLTSPEAIRGMNGIMLLTQQVNSFISAEVETAIDCGTHTLFIAKVTCSGVFNNDRSATYQYYFDNIKPKPAAKEPAKKGFVCKICGYIYEGDELPPDFICPTCKHGVDAFEELK